MNGKAAIAALGDKLPEAARLNGRTPAALSRLLEDDSTMWLNPEGRLFVRDVLDDRHVAQAVDGGLAAAASFSAVAPLSDTFVLHSRPSSTKKIYLDFDGITLGPSAWGWTQKAYGGFDNDGDPTTFNTDERVAIQQVWAQVSEDYAPFDVDVTTEDPGSAALDRDSVADTSFGIRVAITDDLTARAQVSGCSVSCSIVGLAFVDVFDRVKAEAASEYAGPAWVFAHGVGNDPGTIAEIATHEVGHTFGLQHTNLASSALWGSIMNASLTGARITQWVNDGTSNQTAIIASNGAPLVPDEPGNGPGVATSRRFVSGMDGVISTPSDTDWYWVTSCRVGATITAQPADVGADTALKLTLTDASSTTIATDAASTGATGRQDATVTITDASQPEWYFGVEGVGSGPGGADGTIPSGFPDYGSLGRYTLDVVGCDAIATTPSAPRSLSADTAGTTTTVTWSPPSFTGSVGTTALTYEVSLNDGPWTSVGSATSTSLTTTSARQTVAVRAVNVAGAGPAASTFSAVAPQLTRVWVTWDGFNYRILWSSPGASGAPLTEVSFYTSATGGRSFWFIGGSSGQLYTSVFTEGSTWWMTLKNRVGLSQRVAFVVRKAPVVPALVGNVSTLPDKLTGDVPTTWTKPFDDGTGATLTYQVALDNGAWVDVVNPAYTFTGVAPGGHTARIRAVNEVGPGPETQVPFTMEAVDDTAPVITPDVQGTLGGNGWYVGDVTVSFTVTDPESGIASQSAGCAAATLTTDTTATAYTCSATNGVGLTSQEIVTVKRDATKPSLSPTASAAVVAQGGSVTVAAGASDATSGIDAASTGCDPVSTATVGVVTVQCTATDNAGNTQTATVSYTVVNAFLGFQAPQPSAQLSAKSTVSVRFTVGDLTGTSQSTTADTQVRLTTGPNGSGTVVATQACTYSATALAYQCSFKVGKVVTGKNAPPYYLTVFQRVPSATGTWFQMPDGTGVVRTNSQKVFFK